MSSRKCEVFNVDVHRASFAKHLRSKNLLENIKQNEMILPEWLYREPVETKLNNPNSLKQIARDNIKLDDKKLNEELARKMTNPYNFTDKALRVGFKINLDSHHNNLANSKITITPIYSDFRNEVRFIKKIMKELSVIYAILINQYKFIYQTVFSARFDKQDENSQLLDETELFINLNFNHILTESDLDEIDIRSPLEHQIQQQKIW